jgi:hypothetical protein
MEKKDATTLRDGRSHSENGTIGLTRNENGKYLIGDRFSLLTKEGDCHRGRNAFLLYAVNVLRESASILFAHDRIMFALFVFDIV